MNFKAIYNYILFLIVLSTVTIISSAAIGNKIGSANNSTGVSDTEKPSFQVKVKNRTVTEFRFGNKKAMLDSNYRSKAIKECMDYKRDAEGLAFLHQNFRLRRSQASDIPISNTTMVAKEQPPEPYDIFQYDEILPLFQQICASSESEHVKFLRIVDLFKTIFTEFQSNLSSSKCFFDSSRVDIQRFVRKQALVRFEMVENIVKSHDESTFNELSPIVQDILRIFDELIHVAKFKDAVFNCNKLKFLQGHYMQTIAINDKNDFAIRFTIFDYFSPNTDLIYDYLNQILKIANDSHTKHEKAKSAEGSSLSNDLAFKNLLKGEIKSKINHTQDRIISPQKKLDMIADYNNGLYRLNNGTFDTSQLTADFIDVVVAIADKEDAPIHRCFVVA